MINIGDKVQLLPEGYDLLNKSDLIILNKLKTDILTIDDFHQIPITDDDGSNRRLVYEAYSKEIDCLIGLEGIHWKKYNYD